MALKALNTPHVPSSRAFVGCAGVSIFVIACSPTLSNIAAYVALHSLTKALRNKKVIEFFLVLYEHASSSEG